MTSRQMAVRMLAKVCEHDERTGRRCPVTESTPWRESAEKEETMNRLGWTVVAPWFVLLGYVVLFAVVVHVAAGSDYLAGLFFTPKVSLVYVAAVSIDAVFAVALTTSVLAAVGSIPKVASTDDEN